MVYQSCSVAPVTVTHSWSLIAIKKKAVVQH